MRSYKSVLEYWFKELEPRQHWVKDVVLDQEIEQKFGEFHQAGVAGELYEWRSSPEGRLAEIIVLDQFSRNIYRDRPESFSADGMALILAQEAIAAGADISHPVEQRAFLYLPFMHSESLVIHEQAIKLFKQDGMEGNFEFEKQHKVIIERYGRYPHRNEILGRTSTKEEVAFLSQPGSSF